MHSMNKVDANVAQIAALFPNCVTERINEEGKLEKVVDFDMLKQELSSFVVEGNEERYQFTWPDKKKAILAANAPINRTLRPCREESVDFDTTQNLYIEGDNLEVLKLLQETYLGKIKVIYIDPPYNTGNDFVYNDDFSESLDEYLANSGQFDNEGNRLVQNAESNGRFHTDWLNMIYPRIKLAKDLLSDDGVIFISMDENEIENLKKICNEIFGEQNYVQEIIWHKKFSPQNDAKYFSLNHESILCYAKNKPNFNRNLLPATEEMTKRYKNPDNDPRGPWTSGDCTIGRVTEKDYYPITTPSGREVYPSNGNVWRFSRETFKRLIDDNRIWFGENGDNMPRVKRFLSETNNGIVPISIWGFDEVGHTQSASQELKKLFDDKQYFDYPKPVGLIKKAILISTDKDSIVLDFFSGSATTAQATMQLNAEDGGNRRFILVQLPELTEPKTDAYKDGYSNLCEIGKERIRRAGAKIKADSPMTTQDLDTGFRVLKCDSSNMKEVYYNPAELEISLLTDLTDNIKEDRTAEDLLFQVMLDLGIMLSAKVEQTTLDGKTVFNVNGNHLIACFDKEITDETIKAIAKQEPYYFVMRDDGFANDSVATNFEQIFATYSPDTVRKVL
ncbi:MAG: site-specific DNA-methyltransferase [Bacteroidales bacterium]|nr:site-specific DNA-methyltransferase [Bacteroidales bacterium]